MTPAQLRRALIRAGERRHKALTAEREAMQLVRSLAPQAIAAGVPKIEVARCARISRMTLDAILDE